MQLYVFVDNISSTKLSTAEMEAFKFGLKSATVLKTQINKSFRHKDLDSGRNSYKD